MNALVYYGKDDLRFEDIAKPQVLEGQVLIRTEYATLCGTDLAIMNDNGPIWTKLPLVLSHEFTGVVEEIGANVDAIKVGDRVVVDNNICCNRCFYCKNGETYFCDNHTEMGITYNGGFAEFCAIPQTNVIKIPDTLSLKHASLVEPLANAIKVGKYGNIGKGELVVVMGAGPMGVLIAMVCKARGARVIVLERERERIRRLDEMGFEMVIDSGAGDWVDIVSKKYGAYYESWGMQAIDKFVDATETGLLVYDALKIIKRKGIGVLLGLSKSGGDLTIPRNTTVFKDVKLISSSSSQGNLYDAIEYLDKKYVDIDKVITHEFAFADSLEAFETFSRRKGGAFKVVVKIRD